jgi:hypothetical protein
MSEQISESFFLNGQRVAIGQGCPIYKGEVSWMNLTKSSRHGV